VRCVTAPVCGPARRKSFTTETRRTPSSWFPQSFLRDLRAGACPERSRRVVDFHPYGQAAGPVTPRVTPLKPIVLARETLAPLPLHPSSRRQPRSSSAAFRRR